MRQEGVLLRLVEAVHLVHEKHGARSPWAKRAAASASASRTSAMPLSTADRARNSAFAYCASSKARWSCRTPAGPWDHRVHAPGLDGAAQRLPGASEALLADDFVQRPRPHALGQRLQLRIR